MKPQIENQVKELNNSIHTDYWFDITELHRMHSIASKLSVLLEQRFNQVVKERQRINQELEESLE